MVCFSPNQGYKKRGLTANGKHTFTTKKDLACKVKGIPVRMTVPCRRCEGCRMDYAREWAVKICHEARVYLDTDCSKGFKTSFITLTYNDDHIPLYGALSYFDHWEKFMKRLRQAVLPNRIRFYMIGEYGDLNLRPHYHAIIFGYDFPDKFYYMHRGDNIIYRSPLLESLWTVPRGQDGAGSSYGYSSIGDVTVASAAYVARYNMKKLIGQEKHEVSFDQETGEYFPTRYERINQETGDLIVVPPERALMSNGGGSGEGGIGKRWFDQFGISDLYNKGHTHMSNGQIVGAPKYYDKLLERVNPEMLEAIKKSRQDHLSAHADQFTPDRLRQRRECLLGRLKNLKRQIRNVYHGT